MYFYLFIGNIVVQMKNYYDILGVAQDCSQDDIREAYRNLSKKFHPDKNDGNAYFSNMFKQINEANKILSNPSKRSEYDYTHFGKEFASDAQASASDDKYEDFLQKLEDYLRAKNAVLAGKMEYVELYGEDY
jgi:curved DNA-binding protein CbpA